MSRVIAFIVSFAVCLALAWSCGEPGPQCTAAKCAGCCDAASVCHQTATTAACGTNGQRCVACGQGESCVAGACDGGAAAGGQGGGGSGGSAGSGGTGGGAAFTSTVVFNEVCARGSDFLELYNKGSVAADLSDLGVTDQTDDGGLPEYDKALRFPAGTSLASGGFLLVVLNVDAGATTSCLDAGVTSCWGAPWKVSNSRGESVFLLSAANAIIEQADYPASAVASGQSYGRLPDGTGAFGANTPTPAAANQP